MPTMRKRGGFTLLELLVATAILAVILVLVFSITDQTGKALARTSAQITAFQGARNAFTAITRQLSQATLNTYYDYLLDPDTGRPLAYIRQSDLHFAAGKTLLPGQQTHAVFFQAPLGYTVTERYREMDTLLNATGFFVTYGPDRERPGFLGDLPNPPPDHSRFRLMQYLQPAESLGVYLGASETGAWFQDPLAEEEWPAYQLAENVLALILVPRLAEDDQGQYQTIGDAFEYDSRAGGTSPQPSEQNQLPPVMEVIMVAIDEPSANRLGSTNPVREDWFTRIDALDTDLAELTGYLEEKRLNYRVFRSIVAIRGSKWSGLNPASTP